MDQIYQVSPSPHLRDRANSVHIMLTVLAALLPGAIYGMIHFGWRSVLLVVVTTGSAVLSEFLYEYFMKLPITINDGSAALTGLLLAMNLPPTLPVIYGILGSVFAIIIVKQLFGGLGRNFMNPALAARCFLQISFSGPMSTYVYDGVSGATPLFTIKNGGTADLLQMFLGNTAGNIGETCAIALIIGGLFLCAVKIVDWRIPLSYILSFSVFILLLGHHGFDLYYLGCQICGGGLILGAFFMATDYVTSPLTGHGRLVYGVLLGLLTAIFRIYGGTAEGVSYSIIFMNLLVPLIERFTMPKPFGMGGE